MLLRQLLLVRLLVRCDRPAAAIDGSVLVYGLHTPFEEAFQRTLSEKRVRSLARQQLPGTDLVTGVPAVLDGARVAARVRRPAQPTRQAAR